MPPSAPTRPAPPGSDVCFPQMEKAAKLSGALMELHQENSQLMGALQVTEQRQKQAEKRSFLLEEKVGALNELLKEVVATMLLT